MPPARLLQPPFLSRPPVPPLTLSVSSFAGRTIGRTTGSLIRHSSVHFVSFLTLFVALFPRIFPSSGRIIFAFNPRRTNGHAARRRRSTHSSPFEKTTWSLSVSAPRYRHLRTRDDSSSRSSSENADLRAQFPREHLIRFSLSSY